RDRDDREDAGADPRGRPPRQLAPAGRAAGGRRRGDLLPQLRRGGRDPRRDAARVRSEHGGEVSTMASNTAGTTTGAAAEQIKDLADLPSFPAIYAAALDPRSGRAGRGGRAGAEPVLPSIAYRVRKVRI